MKIGKRAPPAALAVLLLLSGCGEECEGKCPSGEIFPDAGSDDVCAPTRAVLKSLDYWIAFDSNRNDQNRDIYLMRPNGEEIRRLTHEASAERSPRFSPDGQKIVFVSDRTGESALFVLDLATKEESGPISRGGVSYLDWSPEGDRIAFSSLDGLLYDVRSDGSDERLLLDLVSDSGAMILHLAYSADGQYLFWDTYGAIGRCNADGSEPGWLWLDVFPIDTPSPDPNGVNVALRASCNSDSAIYLMPWNGDPGPLGGRSICDVGVRISPDGESHDWNPRWGPGFIVFESGQWNRTIKAVEPAAMTLCSVTNGLFDDRNPAWSPRGLVVP
jgi:Tol biopolymer transport system component